VRPGREHDTTAVREHGEILPLLTVWTDDDLRVLGDLGYEGEQVSRVRTKSCPMAFGFPCGRTAEFHAGGQVISGLG